MLTQLDDKFKLQIVTAAGRPAKAAKCTLEVNPSAVRYDDSTGGYGTEQLYLDGDTWTWRGSNVMGVKEHRCTAVVSNDGRTIHARHEKSDDGKRWELWMDVTLTRQE